MGEAENGVSTRLHLLGLPELVKHHICNFLDLSSLMNFRLVCRDLKSCVEQPSVLSKLPVKITVSKQLQRILESKVPFNNFTLNFLSLDEQSYFDEFVKRFGGCIRKLTVKTPGGYQKIALLLKKCVQLEELEINVFGISVLAGNDELLNSILHNFRNLRLLRIHELREKGIPTMAGIEIFLKILHSCKKLREFKIPSIRTYNDKLTLERQLNRQIEAANVIQQQNDNFDLNVEEDWEQGQNEPPVDPLPGWNPKLDRDILIHPVVDYIRSSTESQNHHIKRVDVGAVNYFLWRSFRDLLQACYDREIKVTNVHSSQVLNMRTQILSNTPQYCSVFESAKVTLIHQGFPLSSMDNLKELFLFVDSANEHERLSEGENLLLPHLASLRVQFMFGENKENNKLLIKKLFHECGRPTVKKLHMEWYLLEKSKTVLVKDVTDNFRNLTELILDGWDAVADDFNNLWSNLLELEKITLKDCKNLNNGAFVGKYNLRDKSNIHLRPLNRLKKLHTLIIRDRTGNVNEVALLESFRWISLRYFEFDATRTVNIEWKMYRLLATSPFGKSVEYFTAPLPLPHRYYNEWNVMRNFKNLKRRRLL